MKTFEEFDNDLKNDKIDILPIGTRVICSKGKQDTLEMNGIIGTIVDIDPNGRGYLDYEYKIDLMYMIKLDKTVKDGMKDYYVFHDLVKPLDPKIVDEIRRKKEELRLKHIDIDPLAEEDWED